MDNLALPYQKGENQILQKISRENPRYERNLPHLCSFFQKGTCDRGDLCPYRHVKGETKHSTQSIRDRFYGVNDPVAKKILQQIENSKFLAPPSDKDIRTLAISAVDFQTEEPLKKVLEEYGDVENFSVVRSHAFVTYRTRDQAEKSIKALFERLVVNGKRLKVVWTKKAALGSKNPIEIILPEFALIPAFDDNLESVRGKPAPPTQPHKDLETKKDRDEYLKEMMKPMEKKDYKTMRKDALGGTKPSKKVRLVDY